MPDDTSWTDPVVVPDDARELQADVDAYHRELRHARRVRRWRRITASRTFQRWGFPLGVFTGAAALAALVFGLLAVSGPHGRMPLPPAALASNPASAPGSLGGLLPATQLVDSAGRQVQARDLRPALIALAPLKCDCRDVIASLAAQAEEVQLHLVVVAPAAVDAEIAAMPGQLHHGVVVPRWDANGTLAKTYAARGVTALVVARDGVVTFIGRDVTTQTRLELPLEMVLTS